VWEKQNFINQIYRRQELYMYIHVNDLNFVNVLTHVCKQQADQAVSLLQYTNFKNAIFQLSLITRSFYALRVWNT
jgi:hypothetical protein